MPKLGRGLLLILVLLLAACGTQTQLPEAAADDETTIETASDGHLYYHFKKYVEGWDYAPKHAKFKVYLICRKHDDYYGKSANGPVVLRKAIEVTKGLNVYSGANYGVKGYKCYLKEIADDHYSTGDHVKFYVTQNYEELLNETKDAGRKTVESSYFYPKKDGKLYIIVTNIYKPPATPKTVYVEVNKYFKKYAPKHYYLKVVLICKDGYEKVLLENTTSFKGDLDIYGKHCYLKETFSSKHYKLKKVKFDFRDYYDYYDSHAYPYYDKDYYYADSKWFEVKDYTLVVDIYDYLKRRYGYGYKY